MKTYHFAMVRCLVCRRSHTAEGYDQAPYETIGTAERAAEQCCDARKVGR